MGRLQAEEMARLVDLDTALEWHLLHNHYPPVPRTMIAPCKKAIELARQECFDELIDLPEGIRYKHGQDDDKAPVSALIENYHLDDFLGEPEED